MKPEAPTKTRPSDPSNSIVQIDEFALDKECVRQPSLYLRFANKAAEARRDADEAKNEMEVFEAELKQQIRAHPKEFDLEKVTEGAIAEIVAVQPKLQEAQKAYAAAKHEEAMANAMVNALEHKKRALTLLVNLHGTSYFADVKPNSKGRDAVEETVRGKTRQQVKRNRNEETDSEDDDE